MDFSELEAGEQAKVAQDLADYGTAAWNNDGESVSPEALYVSRETMRLVLARRAEAAREAYAAGKIGRYIAHDYPPIRLSKRLTRWRIKWNFAGMLGALLAIDLALWGLVIWAAAFAAHIMRIGGF